MVADEQPACGDGNQQRDGMPVLAFLTHAVGGGENMHNNVGTALVACACQAAAAGHIWELLAG